MTKEFKDRLKELKQKLKSVNDEFLNIFEKRYIVFIENGTDLKNDCYLFDQKNKQKQWNNQEKMIRIDINRHIAKYDFDVAKKLKPTNMSGVEYHEDFQDTFKLNALMEVF